MSWRVAKSLLVLRDQINRRYPDRSKVSDGTIGDAAHRTRESDHNPHYLGHIVTALDITHDPKAGVDIDRLTDELAASRDPRIKYIIANGLILDSRPGQQPWTWQPYYGSNPHTRHMHISVMPDDSADDTTPWNLPSLTAGGGAAPGGDDDMPSSDEVAEAVWTHWIYNRKLKRREYAETLLGSSEDRIIRQQIAPLRGQVAGLTELVKQLADRADLDLDAVERAAEAGTRRALAEGTVDVDVTVSGGQEGEQE